MILDLDAIELKTPDGRLLKDGLSLSLKEGESLVISGDNGSGKTTLLNYLTAYLKTKYRLQYVPQLANIHSSIPLSLGELIDLAQIEVSKTSIQLLTSEQRERAWNTASGGERKRALMMRALVQKPEILILDEPLNHLDEVSAIHLIDGLSERIQNNELKALILVSHQDEALRLLEQRGCPLRVVQL